jgi:hypothetical protein
MMRLKYVMTETKQGYQTLPTVAKTSRVYAHTGRTTGSIFPTGFVLPPEQPDGRELV